MLGTHVVSDLSLNTISNVLPLKTTWGKIQFQQGLTDITANAATIKARQLPIMALRI